MLGYWRSGFYRDYETNALLGSAYMANYGENKSKDKWQGEHYLANRVEPVKSELFDSVVDAQNWVIDNVAFINNLKGENLYE